MMSTVRSMTEICWPFLKGKELRFLYKDDEGDACVLLEGTWQDAVILASRINGEENDGGDAQRPILIKIEVIVEETSTAKEDRGVSTEGNIAFLGELREIWY